MALAVRVGLGVMMTLVLDLVRAGLKSLVKVLASPVRLLRPPREKKPARNSSNDLAMSAECA
eukprot:1175014-Pyramimonas_sp.AAC.1